MATEIFTVPADYTRTVGGASTSSFAAARDTSTYDQAFGSQTVMIGVGSNPATDPYRIDRAIMSFPTNVALPWANIESIVSAEVRITMLARTVATNQQLRLVTYAPFATPISAGNREAAYDGILTNANTYGQDTLNMNSYSLNTPTAFSFTPTNMDDSAPYKLGFIMHRDYGGNTPAPGPNYTHCQLADESHATPDYRPALIIQCAMKSSGWWGFF